MTKKIEPASDEADVPAAMPPHEVTPTPPGGADGTSARPREVGGRKGPEPTRYGDWEKGGICSDF